MKKITLLLITLFSIPSFAQWTSVSSGTTGNLEAVHFVDSQKGYCGGGFTNLRMTTDGGNTWTSPSTQKVRDFSFSDNTTGYSAATIGDMAKTTNGGTTWTTITSPTTNSLWAVASTNSTTAYFVGTGGVLWKTSNGGASVSVLNSGTTELLTDIVFTNATTGFIIGQQTGIRRTTNSGSTWTVVYPTSSLTEMYFVNANVGYAVGSNLIVKTIDGGQTWTPLTINTSVSLQGVHFYDINNGIAVGLNGKILITNDGGATWNLQNSGTTKHLMGARMLSATKAIVIGDSGTILKNENTTLAVEEHNLANEITLYPNPTSGKISFNSKHEINSIIVSDVSGNIVYNTTPSNMNEYTIDIADFETGIYFLKINSQEGNLVKKIIKN